MDSLTGGNEQGVVNPEHISSLYNAVTERVLTVLALAGESSALETLLVAVRIIFPLLWGSALL